MENSMLGGVKNNVVNNPGSNGANNPGSNGASNPGSNGASNPGSNGVNNPVSNEVNNVVNNVVNNGVGKNISAPTDGLGEEKKDIFNSKDYGNYVVQYYGVYKPEYDYPPNVYVTKIDENFAILSIKLDLLRRAVDTKEIIRIFNSYNNNFKDQFGIIYVQPADVYSLSEIEEISSIEAAQIYSLQFGLSLDLTGKDVVIGIIDTGIDYLNVEFQDSLGLTRIDKLWDQTIYSPGDTREDVPFGTVYKREDINRAIEAKRAGKDPYEIVPSKDNYGHGTHMAGIVGARGVNPNIKGVAPNCDFAIVKLVQAIAFKDFNDLGNDVKVYNSMSIFAAMNYLKDYAIRKAKPLVILLPLGTNNGNHRGEHILDAYIESVSSNIGIVVVTGTGNEGIQDCHVSGTILDVNANEDIELLITKEQKSFYVGIWIDLPNIVDVSLISPSGQATGRIPAVLSQNQNYSFVLEGTKADVYFDLPEKYSGDELIRIYFYDITPGLWRIRLQMQRGKNASYNAWMWQKAFVGEGTRFTPSDPYGTITIPADSDYTVSVAAYNQNNNNLLPYSGVSLINDYLGKIDFAAGGVNTATVGLNNTVAIINGTSLAAAVGAGICGLLLEWGVVKGNYPYMYTQSLKTFLRRGTIQRRGDVYPNQNIGFGIINFYKIFENMT